MRRNGCRSAAMTDRMKRLRREAAGYVSARRHSRELELERGLRATGAADTDEIAALTILAARSIAPSAPQEAQQYIASVWMMGVIAGAEAERGS